VTTPPSRGRRKKCVDVDSSDRATVSRVTLQLIPMKPHTRAAGQAVPALAEEAPTRWRQRTRGIMHSAGQVSEELPDRSKPEDRDAAAAEEEGEGLAGAYNSLSKLLLPLWSALDRVADTTRCCTACDPVGIPARKKTLKITEAAALLDRRGWWHPSPGRNGRNDDENQADEKVRDTGRTDSFADEAGSAFVTSTTSTHFEGKTFVEDKLFAVSGQNLFGLQRAEEAYRSLEPTAQPQHLPAWPPSSPSMHFRQPRFSSSDPYARSRPSAVNSAREGREERKERIEDRTVGRGGGEGLHRRSQEASPTRSRVRQAREEWMEWEASKGPHLILSDWDPRHGVQHEEAWLIQGRGERAGAGGGLIGMEREERSDSDSDSEWGGRAPEPSPQLQHQSPHRSPHSTATYKD